jgi:HSP20 family molecular chaperone IbpA
MTPEDINVEFDNGVLTVSGQKKMEKEEKDKEGKVGGGGGAAGAT